MMDSELVFRIDPDAWEVVGYERMRAIAKAANHAIQANMRLSHDLAMSGAMRWPMSMRPEVCVLTRVDIN